MTKTFKVRSLIGKKRKIIGALGEALVVKHLRNKGFTHIMSNFLRKQGEIDVIMLNDGVLHFFEVKTVSRENKLVNLRAVNAGSNGSSASVIRETNGYSTAGHMHMPEENVNPVKLRKISKMIQIYLGEYGIGYREWQFHVAVVFLDQKNKKACIKFIKNVPLGSRG